MKRLKSPEIPDLKVPAAVADLYFDLRERRLLPLIALVIVAIVAAPFLLGSDPEPVVPPPVVGDVAGDEAATTSFTVVEAKPGLRAPGKRLDARTPANPFKQRYTSLPKAAQLESTTTGSAESEGSGDIAIEVEEVEGTSVPVPGGGSGTPASAPPSGPNSQGLHFFAFRPDIRFGIAGSGELNEYKELPLGAVLPEKNPVVAFLAISESGKRAFFHVSTEVVLVKGPGHCIGGPQSCSLLSLKEGQAADIITAKPDRSFRLKVERIEFVEVERPNPAGASSAGGSAPGTPGFDLAQSFSK